ncbi:exodeoxyribonuclease I [Jeongeupia chitinilytica]|uniref:Exodeoxyribonuclease I n=1 Tax=Jeongeupia chitinilytica TaxID=1041641 RepID=A0ABQ3H553_9NEIS|nr:exodeoxyribonuclease I [Jeongeupia chitinilytica]GHD65309.1 exodeoxyribonuclease I [Jeongeupia chitinilytica]
MSSSFFWHDYETFGIVPRRDRPAQFAGIRTDLELNEIAAPVELFCQPTPDFLPDPESCLLTGITPQQCLERGVSERDFAAGIEAELARPGTIGVGYNTIRFDDEVTRFLFWRNLYDPYAREWQNDCGRWDLLDTVRTTWALRPDGINWPNHDDGRPSFKLEHLSAANGLAHEAAHDAVSDVRATIALARLIRDRQPKLFDFCLSLRKKDAVQAQIGAEPKPFLHISGMFGTERGCMAVVWPLATHPTNKNELIVWDLAFDPRELFSLDAETIRTRMFSRADALPEGVTRLPIKTIHINKSPIVIGNLKTLQPAQAERWGVDFELVERHAALLRDAPALPWAQVFKRDLPPVTDVDQDLYGGFLSNNDRRTLEKLRGLDGDALATSRISFDDRRLDELLFRYRARNFPASLTEAEVERWQLLRGERLFEGRDGYLTLEDYCGRIDTLAETADERGEQILAALYDYAETIAPEYAG